eukprot:64495_1
MSRSHLFFVLFPVLLHLSTSYTYQGPANQSFFQENLPNANVWVLSCGDLFPASTNIFPYVDYWWFDLTLEMKQQHSSIQVSTCCDPSNDQAAPYCNSASLDTYLYLLREKRGQISLLQTNDDCSAVSCPSNTNKSIIDLSPYPEGEYYIAVGGFLTDIGLYAITVECDSAYSYPIKPEQINETNTTVQELSCGQTLWNQTNTVDDVVSFYSLNLNFTDDMFPPITISTCDVNNTVNITEFTGILYHYLDSSLDTLFSPYNMSYNVSDHFNDSLIDSWTKSLFEPYILQYDTYISLIQRVTKEERVSRTLSSETTYTIFDSTDYSSICDTSIPSDIIINKSHQYPPGTYLIAVQGWENYAGNFSIRMTCGTAPITPKIYPQHIVMIMAFGLLGFGIIAFIVWYVSKMRKYQPNKAESPADQSQHHYASIDPQEDINIESDKDEIEANPMATGMHLMRAPSIGAPQLSRERIPAHASVDDITGEHGEDRIQRCLSHVLGCCEDESGLDIYQLFAIRCMDSESRKMRLFKPFVAFGSDVQLLTVSSYHRALFMVIVIGLLQTMGITVVVYKLFYAYFYQEDVTDQCSMEVDRWNEVYSLKILSFLFSLVITFHISTSMASIEHNGLYKTVTELEPDEINAVHCVRPCWLRWGQAINYYACLVAVIGSFFIIFETNKGEKNDDGTMDYSHSGLEMILNALALFFMLELDEVILSYQDYRDVEACLNAFNEKYNKNRYKGKENGQVSTCGAQNVCAKVTNVFAFFVRFCLYLGGAVLPFLIFVCW